jgi:hypothetical protein
VGEGSRSDPFTFVYYETSGIKCIRQEPAQDVTDTSALIHWRYGFQNDDYKRDSISSFMVIVQSESTLEYYQKRVPCNGDENQVKGMPIVI